jgi:hypothetical protein
MIFASSNSDKGSHIDKIRSQVLAAPEKKGLIPLNSPIIAAPFVNSQRFLQKRYHGHKNTVQALVSQVWIQLFRKCQSAYRLAENK